MNEKTVINLLKNSQDINELLNALHESAKNYDMHCGLPIYNDSEVSKMKLIVLEWLTTLLDKTAQ